MWVCRLLDFLTKRSQRVKFNSVLLNVLLWSTGSPSLCFIHSIYKCLYAGHQIINCADDSVILSLLSHGNTDGPVCSKVAGTTLNTISDMYKIRTLKKAHYGLDWPEHLRLLPSSRRYVVQRSRTNHFENSKARSLNDIFYSFLVCVYVFNSWLQTKLPLKDKKDFLDLD